MVHRIVSYNLALDNKQDHYDIEDDKYIHVQVLYIYSMNLHNELIHHKTTRIHQHKWHHWKDRLYRSKDIQDNVNMPGIHSFHHMFDHEFVIDVCYKLTDKKYRIYNKYQIYKT